MADGGGVREEPLLRRGPVRTMRGPDKGTMAKKKDCFGSESYVCRTQNCPYMSECVQLVWEKKLRRIVSRKSSRLDSSAARSVRVRSKEFTSK